MKRKNKKYIKSKVIPIISVLLVIISLIGLLNNIKQAKEVFATEKNGENNIIPKPLSYEGGKGKFILTKDSSIYIKGNTTEEVEEVSKVAQFIKGKLKASTGFELNIIKDGKPKDGSIYLTTVGGKKEQGNLLIRRLK